jgi:hypothetical protein
LVAVSIACTGAAGLDVTEDRAGIATDGVVLRHDWLRRG